MHLSIPRLETHQHGRHRQLQLAPSVEPRSEWVDNGVLELFMERVSESGARVHRRRPDQVDATLAELLGSSTTLVPDGFPFAIPHGVAAAAPTGTLARVRSAVSVAAVAAGTTGSLVVLSGDNHVLRALSWVVRRHVCLVGAERVVRGVPEAVAAVNPHVSQTWLCGPRRAGDLPTDLIGVFATPAALDVVIIEGREGRAAARSGLERSA